MPDLLEVHEVAKRLDRTPASVRAYADQGKLPVAVITARGARLFRPADVQKFKRARENQRLTRMHARRIEAQP
jgi:DNA-binding transcriptional MerR regulator